MQDLSDGDLEAIAWMAMEQYGFIPAFPPPIIREVGALAPNIVPEALGGYCDLRPLLWSSIDNHDSRDLDQIEVCESAPGGEIRISK